MCHHLRVIPSAARDLFFNPRSIALCTIGLVTAFSLSAQEPVPLAHGNVPGEPHHHLKIENEYVRAYYVEVPPHENTQLHRHDHDYIYVSLGPADVVNAILNKPEIHLQLKDSETHFTRGGFAHVARNLADTPFRNVTIELLHPQGAARNVCGPVILNAGIPICDPAPGLWSTMTQFETAEVALDKVVFYLKGEYKEKASKFPFLVIGLAGPEVKINAKRNSRKTLHEGELEWFDPGSEAQFSSIQNGGTAQFLKLTFKDNASSADR